MIGVFALGAGVLALAWTVVGAPDTPAEQASVQPMEGKAEAEAVSSETTEVAPSAFTMDDLVAPTWGSPLESCESAGSVPAPAVAPSPEVANEGPPAAPTGDIYDALVEPHWVGPAR